MSAPERDHAPSPYPPYSGRNATCTKFGNAMTEKYMSAGTVFVSLADGGCVFGYGAGPEWLFRECLSCGYGWPEQCRDAGAEPERDHETAELLHRSDLARDVAHVWVGLTRAVQGDVDPDLAAALDRLAAVYLPDSPRDEPR